MNEKMKRLLLSLLCRAMAAAGIFAGLVVLKKFVPHVFENCSNIWIKNTDLTRVGQLLGALAKEIIPF